MNIKEINYKKIDSIYKVNKEKNKIMNKLDKDKNKELFVKIDIDSEFIEIYNKCLNIYGPNVLKENGVDPKSLNILSFMDRFFENQEDVSEITVDSNSNTIYSSITNFKNEAPKSLHKLFSLYRLHKKIKELYSLKDANNCIESILNGNLFFNDLSKGIYPYCYAFDIGKLITKGMDFYKGNGSIFIKPPKRSSTFLQQLVQTTSFASNQISGAVSYPSLFVILDYFYRLQFGEDYINELRDKSNKELAYFIHNEFQSIIFSFNTPCRDGGESSFVNLSIMDTGFLENLFKDYIIKIEDDVIYKPNIYNVLELSKEFFEYFSEINSKESLFTFPVITLAISIDENGNYIDPDFVDWVSIHNSKKALGNIFQAPPYKYSTCCRLISDYSQLQYVNSFGVGGLEIGSTRVCGLNLPRIALQENQDLYLNERLKEVRYILTAHRNIVDELIHKGNLPLYTYDWINVNKQYSTVGFIGAYEFVINSGFDLFSEQGKNSLLNLLQSIGNTISSWNKESNFRFNIEQIPGESMAIRMANIDRFLNLNPNNFELYSNQYIPLTLNNKQNGDLVSIYDRLYIQGLFDSFTTGGAICHINIDDSQPLSSTQNKLLIETAKDLGVVYFAINYVFSQSESDVFSIGKHDICPITGENIKYHYSRVVGYLTNEQNWKLERREEFKKRNFYSLPS